MNPSTVETVAIVVALADRATPGLRARLARFADEAGPLGEVVLVDASGTRAGLVAAEGLANIRVLSRPAGRLAPTLWRDGLLATDATLVAFTTAQMKPREGWLGSLKDQLRKTNAAGVGGPIEPAPRLSRTDRAVALLRYSTYFPAKHPGVLGRGRATTEGKTDRPMWRKKWSLHPDPVGWALPTKTCLPGQGLRMVGGAHPTRSESSASILPPLGRQPRIEPPGDNSLYRRDPLMSVESAWIDGFWEVDVHQALRDRGEALAMAESAVITFEGGIGLGSMTIQRLRHGRRYGAGRSNGLGPMARVARAVASPLVPPLLCVRIIGALQSRGMGLGPWIAAGPRLIWLASAWAFGEALGTLTPFASSKFIEQRRDLVTQHT